MTEPLHVLMAVMHGAIGAIGARCGAYQFWGSSGAIWGPEERATSHPISGRQTHHIGDARTKDFFP